MLRLAPALLAALVALPVAPALAVPAEAGVEVEVVALVERVDGSLAVQEQTVDSAAEADDLLAELRAHEDVVAADVPVAVRIAADPLQDQQWGLAAVHAERAWELGDAAGQVVAVVDTGVVTSHPDLADALTAGQDFVDGDADPNDLNGHGTHVAGIVAGVAGNGIGIAGVAPGARVMPVRVLEADGSGSSATVTRGILWAADNGATVINLSLGGPERDSVLERAIDYARGKGVTVVAAAGNQGLTGDPVNYPAASPGVLAVGAVDSGLTRPGFSSSGDHLAVAAPGVQVLSTVPGGWGYMSGTSMAAPSVAAAAAVLKAAAVRAGSALSATALRDLLTSTAADLGAPGHDRYHGAGLLDLYAARSKQVTDGQPGPAAAAPAPAPAAPPEPARNAAPEAAPDTPAAPVPVLRDLSLACPLASLPTTLLGDLTGNHHRRAVECLLWWRVASGRSATSYEPASTVTRGQMATFLANTVLRSGGSLPPADLARFADDDGTTHEQSIGRLAAAGIVQGTAAGTYAPGAPVTRAQMATFLVRSYEHISGSALAAPALPFLDVAPGGHADNVAKATGAGLTAGATATAFRPADAVRRDQMGSFVARVLDLLVEDGTASPPLP
jgi:subtilisin family serine protease